LEFGVWSLEFGVWSLEFGVWSLEYKTKREPIWIPFSVGALPLYYITDTVIYSPSSLEKSKVDSRTSHSK